MSEHSPEVQQPCAAWAEGQAELLGPVRAGGAPWEAEEEAEVEEALLEVHASSAASGQLQNNSRVLKLTTAYLNLQFKRRSDMRMAE